MARIIYDAERIGPWVCERAGGTWIPGRGTAIGLERDGEIVAGVLYEDFNGANVVMHVASDGTAQWMTPEYLRTLATKEYPFLKASDNERLKRIEMPEGDLLVAEELMKSVFSSDGVVSDEKFAKTFSGLQSAAAPLTTFGANKRWAKIAGVHGSLDASSKKLNVLKTKI